MQEKHNLPTWLITRIWFLANCILAGLFVLYILIQTLTHSSSSESFGIYFAVIFIGLLLSLPSLILLIVLNDIFNIKRFANFSINAHISICILLVNFFYLVFTFICVEVDVTYIVFYTITTLSGLVASYSLTKNYKPENEF